MNIDQAPTSDPSNRDLRVLIVEDSQIEAKFITNLLKKNGYTVTHDRVETEGDMRRALNERKWDIVISDYQMPDFDGTRALKLFQTFQLDIPFILVSGKIGEETAVDLMKLGAHDYVMKGNNARLIPAIQSQLEQAANRRETVRLEKRLRESEAQYRGFFENAHIGIFRCSETGLLLDANRRLANAFGFDSPKEFIRTIESLRPEIHDLNTRQARLVPLSELANQTEITEVIFHRADSSTMEAKINVWGIQEDPSAPLYFEGVIEDITEQKAMERKLREMEELHESLIDLTSNL